MLDVVIEKGHGKVTTAEVAARASTSEATVLYDYPSKDHLLVAALELDRDLGLEQAERDSYHPEDGLTGLSRRSADSPGRTGWKRHGP